jgi:hypothetical protein
VSNKHNLLYKTWDDRSKKIMVKKKKKKKKKKKIEGRKEEKFKNIYKN